MTGRDRAGNDSRVPPAVRAAEHAADDARGGGALAPAPPWWSQVRLTARKADAGASRSGRRRRSASSGDGPPPTRPLRLPTPRRIGGSLLLAIGYSLAVWSALFLIADALGDVL